MRRTKTNTFANRGMGLEEDLEITNQHYLNKNIAIIYKKPTPITIKKVTYPNQKYTKIIDGYFQQKSTTDYNGIYNGRYIDFEAKETKNKTFNMKLLKSHQLNHLQNVVNHGGIAFLIIRFTTLNKTFLIDIEKLSNYLTLNDKKSLNLEFLEKNGHEIKVNYLPRLDYLKVVDKIYF